MTRCPFDRVDRSYQPGTTHSLLEKSTIKSGDGRVDSFTVRNRSLKCPEISFFDHCRRRRLNTLASGLSSFPEVFRKRSLRRCIKVLCRLGATLDWQYCLALAKFMLFLIFNGEFRRLDSGSVPFW